MATPTVQTRGSARHKTPVTAAADNGHRKGGRYAFEPAYDKEKALALDAHSANPNLGTTRRVMLMVMTRSSEELQAWVRNPESTDSYFAVIDAITGFREHATGLVEAAETAIARMLLAGEAVAGGAQ